MIVPSVTEEVKMKALSYATYNFRWRTLQSVSIFFKTIISLVWFTWGFYTKEEFHTYIYI